MFENTRKPFGDLCVATPPGARARPSACLRALPAALAQQAHHAQRSRSSSGVSFVGLVLDDTFNTIAQTRARPP